VGVSREFGGSCLSVVIRSGDGQVTKKFWKTVINKKGEKWYPAVLSEWGVGGEWHDRFEAMKQDWT
jgi:hypothetical protein